MPNRFLALTAALLLLCSGCAPVSPADSAPADTSVEVSAPDASVPAVFTPDEPVPAAPPPAPKPAPAPAEPPPIPDEPPTPPTEPEPVAPDYEPEVPTFNTSDSHPSTPYDFSSPVPDREPVSTDYFADAAFVGDSRTEGFWLYSGVKQGKLLSATGLTVFSVNSKTAINSSQTVLQALKSGSFGKIYLAFGVNELGYIDTDSFVQTYRDLIDTIRAAHPDAVIYIQNLIPVNDAQARASGHKGHVNCDRVRLYNDMIAQIAREKEVPLLDLYSAFAVDGQLPADSSRDGVHLLPAACKRQLDYLMTHTVTRTQLTAQPVIDLPAEPTNPIEPEVLPETEVTEI